MLKDIWTGWNWYEFEAAHNENTQQLIYLGWYIVDKVRMRELHRTTNHCEGAD